MIENSENFTLLGLYEWSDTQILAFREGMYIAHRNLLAGETDSHEADDADTDSEIEDLGAQGESSNLFLPSVEKLLGWNPFDELLFAGPVDRTARQALFECRTGQQKNDFMAALKAGQYAPKEPSPSNHWISYRRFNEVCHWQGVGFTFHPVGSQKLESAGLTRDRACRLLGRDEVEVAVSNRLHPLRNELDAHLLATVAHAAKPALLFDRGIYIQQHENVELVGWHPLQGNFHGSVPAHLAPTVCRCFEKAKGIDLENACATAPWVAPGEPGSHFIFTMTRALGARSAINLGAPVTVYSPSKSPESVSRASARETLLQGRFAPAADPLMVRHRDQHVPHEWSVDAFEWTLRLAAMNSRLVRFMPYRLHDKLTALASGFLTAQQAHEKAWLDADIVRMPFAELLALMEMDTAMQCGVCRIDLPAEVYPDVLKLGGIAVKGLEPINTMSDLQRLLPTARNALLMMGSGSMPLPSIHITAQGDVVGQGCSGPLSDLLPDLGAGSQEDDSHEIQVRALIQLA